MTVNARTEEEPMGEVKGLREEFARALSKHPDWTSEAGHIFCEGASCSWGKTTSRPDLGEYHHLDFQEHQVEALLSVVAGQAGVIAGVLAEHRVTVRTEHNGYRRGREQYRAVEQICPCGWTGPLGLGAAHAHVAEAVVAAMVGGGR